MPLTSGSRLGPYEITSPLGAGGMGEVYRARDMTLGRDVAIKVLPESFTHDPERVGRFKREAQVLAALNHPHIAQIYGLEGREGQDGREGQEPRATSFIVMELVEGETLAQRIARGRLPLDEALRIARQIADALEAAHEKGIIHRDLKPANIAVTANEQVKVLDFGLAKAIEPSGSSDLPNSPTLTFAATQMGVILGTAAYMSPEQAKGRAVDKRSDIWAFGCVLFEMLTGRKAFDGEDVSDTLAFVLTREADWSALAPTTPPVIRRLLSRCLQKDRRQRLADIADARLDLDEAATAPSESAITSVAVPSQSPWRRAGQAAGVLMLLLAAVGVTWFAAGRIDTPTRIVRFTLRAPDGHSFSASSPPAVSPDGTRVAFVAMHAGGVSTLWIRSLDALAATPVAGTEGASLPFWSPDSSGIGFFAAGKLKKTAITGGPPQTLADAPTPIGGTWGSTGVIVFAPRPGSPLFRIAAAGGTPAAATTLGESGREVTHAWPSFLPDGRHFVFFVQRNPTPNATAIGVLDSGDVRRVSLPDVARVEVRSGFFLFPQDGGVFAQPFDDRRLDVVGEQTLLTEAVASLRDVQFLRSMAANFSASVSGVLAYERGSNASGSIVWVDRRGDVQRTVAEVTDGGNTSPSLSADGTRLAVTLAGDIWVLDLARGTRTRLSFDGGSVNLDPIWSPDGRQVVYASHPKGVDQFVQRPSSGGDATILPIEVRGSGFARPIDWSADGRYLAYAARDEKTGSDVFVLDVAGRTSRMVTKSQFNETGPHFSPDARWIVYQSDETGRNEIFVRAFPEGDSKYQISLEGGSLPRWRRDGREIFWIAPDNTLMASSVRTGPRFEVDTPVALFDSHVLRAGRGAYDVAADGQHFVIQLANERPFDEMTVVINWPATLKK